MTGTPTPDPFTDRQLEVIQRQINSEVSRQLIGTRFAASEDSRDIRLAKTVKQGGKYPSSGNTFAVRFVDCGFTPKAPGTSTMSCTERTAEGDTDGAADVIARTIDGEYRSEGTYVFALWQRGTGDPSTDGEWWIL